MDRLSAQLQRNMGRGRDRVGAEAMANGRGERKSDRQKYSGSKVEYICANNSATRV